MRCRCNAFNFLQNPHRGHSKARYCVNSNFWFIFCLPNCNDVCNIMLYRTHYNGTLQYKTRGTFNTLRPRQDGRHFADAIFTCIFFNENCCILIKFSVKYVPKGPIDINLALFQIMAWRQSGDKPLSEAMMVSLLTHIFVAPPQWIKHSLIARYVKREFDWPWM